MVPLPVKTPTSDAERALHNPALTLTPQQQRSRTLDEIAAWLFEEAERQPVLQIWEDLNWADPTTQEFLALELEQCPTVALMIAITYRPEFSPPWAMRSHMTPLTLNRLERIEVEQLIDHHAGGKALPPEVVARIADKADGVPMYVEELTKTIIESDSLREQEDRFELTGPLSELRIPSTLQDSLTARLDRLPSGREVAQLGAVLGREFSYDMIRALSTLEEPQLQEGLNQLVEAELMYQRGRPPRAKYIFKQALIQDAAYQLLLKRTRQQYHQQVAALLQAQFPDTVEAHPELLAHHYTAAGLTEQAIGYWYEAGRLAAQRSANVEAVAQLTNGLELITTLPETPDRACQELAILMTLGPALIASKGYGAPEVSTTYTRAKVLADQTDDQTALFPILRGQWNSYLFTARMHEARRRGEELQQLAQQQNDSGLVIEACRIQGTASFFMGDFQSVQTYTEQGVALYDPEQHHELALVFGADPGVICQLYGGLGLWMLGYPEQAQRTMDAAIALTKQRSHGHTEAFALCFQSVHHRFRHDISKTLEWAQATHAVAAKLGLRQWLSWSMISNGWATALAGQWEEGLAQLDGGLADWRSLSPEFIVPYFLALKAEILTQRDRTGETLELLNEAQALAARNAEGLFEAEIYRLQGEATLIHADGQDDAAQACFQHALETARRQSARSLELRAATSLARLWREQDRHQDARDLLAPVYDWFTEGMEISALKGITRCQPATAFVGCFPTIGAGAITACALMGENSGKIRAINARIYGYDSASRVGFLLVFHLRGNRR